MERVWFWLIVSLLALYAVLDGFDFGVGALHLFVAKTDKERRTVLSAIGPYWDGNEVWLLAAGGALMLAFPPVIAAGFSGFYLAMYMVVWTLTLRGIAIEFRNHVEGELWRPFWDVVFAASSALMPVLLGAALGNVVRGVPIDESGYFNIPLFTNFTTNNPVGVLDWYSTLVGAFVLSTLVGHGALFLAWKTEGDIRIRAERIAVRIWLTTSILGCLSTVATAQVNAELFARLSRSPLAWFNIALFVTGLLAVFWGLWRKRHRWSFCGSAGFVIGILGVTAACAFPVMIRSSLRADYSLTAYNASSGAHGLRAGLLWLIVGFPIALLYVAFLFHIHRGRTHADRDEY